MVGRSGGGAAAPPPPRSAWGGGRPPPFLFSSSSRSDNNKSRQPSLSSSGIVLSSLNTTNNRRKKKSRRTTNNRTTTTPIPAIPPAPPPPPVTLSSSPVKFEKPLPPNKPPRDSIITVFWDLETMPPPTTSDDVAVSEILRRLQAKFGPTAKLDVRCYYYNNNAITNNKQQQNFPECVKLVESLRRTKPVVDRAGGMQLLLDPTILIDAMRFAHDHASEPGTICLIVPEQEVAYSYLFSNLPQWRRVMVTTTTTTGSSSAVASFERFDWTELTQKAPSYSKVLMRNKSSAPEAKVEPEEPPSEVTTLGMLDQDLDALCGNLLPRAFVSNLKAIDAILALKKEENGPKEGSAPAASIESPPLDTYQQVAPPPVVAPDEEAVMDVLDDSWDVGDCEAIISRSDTAAAAETEELPPAPAFVVDLPTDEEAPVRTAAITAAPPPPLPVLDDNADLDWEDTDLAKSVISNDDENVVDDWENSELAKSIVSEDEVSPPDDQEEDPLSPPDDGEEEAAAPIASDLQNEDTAHVASAEDGQYASEEEGEDWEDTVLAKSIEDDECHKAWETEFQNSIKERQFSSTTVTEHEDASKNATSDSVEQPAEEEILSDENLPSSSWNVSEKKGILNKSAIENRSARSPASQFGDLAKQMKGIENDDPLGAKNVEQDAGGGGTGTPTVFSSGSTMSIASTDTATSATTEEADCCDERTNCNANANAESELPITSDFPFSGNAPPVDPAASLLSLSPGLSLGGVAWNPAWLFSGSSEASMFDARTEFAEVRDAWKNTNEWWSRKRSSSALTSAVVTKDADAPDDGYDWAPDMDDCLRDIIAGTSYEGAVTMDTIQEDGLASSEYRFELSELIPAAPPGLGAAVRSPLMNQQPPPGLSLTKLASSAADDIVPSDLNLPDFEPSSEIPVRGLEMAKHCRYVLFAPWHCRPESASTWKPAKVYFTRSRSGLYAIFMTAKFGEVEAVVEDFPWLRSGTLFDWRRVAERVEPNSFLIETDKPLECLACKEVYKSAVSCGATKVETCCPDCSSFRNDWSETEKDDAIQKVCALLYVKARDDIVFIGEGPFRKLLLERYPTQCRSAGQAYFWLEAAINSGSVFKCQRNTDNNSRRRRRRGGGETQAGSVGVYLPSFAAHVLQATAVPNSDTTEDENYVAQVLWGNHGWMPRSKLTECLKTHYAGSSIKSTPQFRVRVVNNGVKNKRFYLAKGPFRHVVGLTKRYAQIGLETLALNEESSVRQQQGRVAC